VVWVWYLLALSKMLLVLLDLSNAGDVRAVSYSRKGGPAVNTRELGIPTVSPVHPNNRESDKGWSKKGSVTSMKQWRGNPG